MQPALPRPLWPQLDESVRKGSGPGILSVCIHVYNRAKQLFPALGPECFLPETQKSLAFFDAAFAREYVIKQFGKLDIPTLAWVYCHWHLGFPVRKAQLELFVAQRPTDKQYNEICGEIFALYYRWPALQPTLSEYLRSSLEAQVCASYPGVIPSDVQRTLQNLSQTIFTKRLTPFLSGLGPIFQPESASTRQALLALEPSAQELGWLYAKLAFESGSAMEEFCSHSPALDPSREGRLISLATHEPKAALLSSTYQALMRKRDTAAVQQVTQMFEQMINTLSDSAKFYLHLKLSHLDLTIFPDLDVNPEEDRQHADSLYQCIAPLPGVASDILTFLSAAHPMGEQVVPDSLRINTQKAINDLLPHVRLWLYMVIQTDDPAAYFDSSDGPRSERFGVINEEAIIEKPFGLNLQLAHDFLTLSRRSAGLRAVWSELLKSHLEEHNPKGLHLAKLCLSQWMDKKIRSLSEEGLAWTYFSIISRTDYPIVPTQQIRCRAPSMPAERYTSEQLCYVAQTQPELLPQLTKKLAARLSANTREVLEQQLEVLLKVWLQQKESYVPLSLQSLIWLSRRLCYRKEISTRHLSLIEKGYLGKILQILTLFPNLMPLTRSLLMQGLEVHNAQLEDAQASRVCITQLQRGLMPAVEHILASEQACRYYAQWCWDALTDEQQIWLAFHVECGTMYSKDFPESAEDSTDVLLLGPLFIIMCRWPAIRLSLLTTPTSAQEPPPRPIQTLDLQATEPLSPSMQAKLPSVINRLPALQHLSLPPGEISAEVLDTYTTLFLNHPALNRLSLGGMEYSYPLYHKLCNSCAPPHPKAAMLACSLLEHLPDRGTRQWLKHVLKTGTIAGRFGTIAGALIPALGGAFRENQQVLGLMLPLVVAYPEAREAVFERLGGSPQWLHKGIFNMSGLRTLRISEGDVLKIMAANQYAAETIAPEPEPLSPPILPQYGQQRPQRKRRQPPTDTTGILKKHKGSYQPSRS